MARPNCQSRLQKSQEFMPQINIELPEKFLFSTEIQLLGIHINVGGHLDNALLLSLATEARSRYWQHLGYNPLDIEGVRVFVADAAVQYKSEAFHNEVMVIELAANDFNKYGFDIVWRIRDKASGREIARGKTGSVCVGVESRKVTVIPEKFRAKLTDV